MAAAQHKRSRFVAFAFAAADLLLAIGPDDHVVFAAGAARPFAGVPAEDLIGRALTELVAEPDRALVRYLLRRARNGERVGPATIVAAGGDAAGHLRALLDPGSPETVALVVTDLRTSRISEPGGPHGLLDRAALQRTLERILDAGAAGAGPLHLSLFDLQGFDNALQGTPQEVAEEVLAAVAAVLRAGSLEGRSAAELAPGRYAVLHEDTARGKQLEREIDQILAGSALADQVQLSHRLVPLAEPAMGMRELRDALVYALSGFASHGGAACPASLADALAAGLRETMQRVEAVRSTIRQARFTLSYQPIVELPGRTPHHWEAFVRFADDEGGPAATIDFAEQVGLVVELDLLVLRHVLAELAKSLRDRAGMRIAVNLSARSLASDVFIEQLRRTLASAAVPANSLLFEVTESYELTDLARAEAVLGSLRRQGYEVCIDDFGAGAAAFQYIRHLSVDYVKLDGSYTRKLCSSPRDRQIVESVLQLCSGLGVPVIAEMVETEQQCAALVGLGVRYAQGFLFGRPQAGLPAAPVRSARRRGEREQWS